MPLMPPPSAGIGEPPRDARAALAGLAEGLDADVPPKRDGNLVIATWNVKHFGRVTKRWSPRKGDSPKRTLRDLLCIAEVISRFDVVALVEVKRNLEALRLMMRILGKRYGFIVSDVTEGDAGNDERLGYVFDLDRVSPSGLAGELVIPPEVLDDPEGVIDTQFARTPYTVSFQAGDKGFTLVTLHILYGERDEPERRTPELRAIAKWLRDHADDPDEFNRNMIALGDFNIDRIDDPNWHAFVVEYGLSPPDKLLDVPRTVGETRDKHSFYDQIAWFNDGKRAKLTLGYRDAGGFEWTRYLLERTRQSEKEARISDHYPLWAEFSLAG